jgi:CAAX prenyl protease-like protein
VIEDGHGAATAYLYFLQAAVPAALMVLFWRHYSELHTAPGGVLAWTVATVAGLVIFTLWISATAPWMRIGEPLVAFVPQRPDGSLQWELVLVRLMGAVLVVPLMEEIFWRSYLMRRIDSVDFVQKDPRLCSPIALVASSAVFALEHDLWLAGLLAGLAYGLLFMWTRSIWFSIAAHATTNLALGIWVIATRNWQFW